MITRREALGKVAAASIVCAAAPQLGFAQPTTLAAVISEPFKLPPLPYAVDALEPHIDARTMEIHHGKHHAAYVQNLNKAIAEAPELRNMSIEQILQSLDTAPEKVRTALRNNGGGHYNHELFWQMLKPGGGGQPTGELARAIDHSFGSFSAFKDRMTEAAAKVFGSGWAWVIQGADRKLQVVSTANQDSPMMKLSGIQAKTGKPLLGIDVWEHAYYLKYQNRRAEYINAWFNVIHWDYVAHRLRNG